jgi:TatD DNase family protein
LNCSCQNQDKLISVHAKGAETDVFSLLKKYGNKKVTIHWYSGEMSTLKEMIKQGFYFSVGLEVLFSENMKTIAQEIPLEQILSETDNPGGFKELTGKKGMPLLIRDVLSEIASIKGIQTGELEKNVLSNFRMLAGDILQ